MKWILWNFLNLTLGFAAVASPTSFETREFYSSVRSLGMGNTGVAVANDETAMFINPAGLGKLRDIYGTFIDPEVELNNNAMNMYRTKAYTSPWDLEDTAPAMVASPGDYFHFRGQVFPSVVMKNFGIGVLYKRVNDGVYTTSTNTIDSFYQDDFAVALGYNLRLFEGRIKIGVTGRLMNRTELIKSDLSPTPSMSALNASGDLKNGTGFGTDVGVMLAAPWIWLPTLGIKVNDVGGTSFNMSVLSRGLDTIAKPSVVKQDADIGFAIYPIYTNTMRAVWTVEYKHALTADTQSDKMKNVHFGTEFGFSDIFFLRAGYNQRYWTAGLELASESFQLQLTTYGEEIGDETTPLEDRRFVGKFTFRF